MKLSSNKLYTFYLNLTRGGGGEEESLELVCLSLLCRTLNLCLVCTEFSSPPSHTSSRFSLLMFYSLGSLFSINGRACFRALPATPYLLSFSLALKLTAYQQIDKVTTEDELHGVLLEEDVIDALDEVGYRGVPQREKLESKDKILRFFFCLCFFSHSCAFKAFEQQSNRNQNSPSSVC